jgi:hypothetical protein
MFSFDPGQYCDMPPYLGNPTIQHVDAGSQQPWTSYYSSEPFAVTTTESESTWMGFHPPDQIYSSIGDVQNTE